jgi:hypothetical protein
MVARLAAGETLLVHGGGSGIGTMAIQLGKAFGATVACTAGSAQKLARCRELGADITVNYREEDFVAAVLDATGGAGADVILDIMGASYLARNLATLATDGRLVIIGRQGGRNRPGCPAGQAGQRARDHAAVPADRAEGRGGGGRARPGLAAHRRRAGRRGHRPGAAHVPGGTGAPGHGGQRSFRQDLAAGRMNPTAPGRRPDPTD